MRPVLLGMAGGLFLASSLLAVDEWAIRGIAWSAVPVLTRYHIAAFAAGAVFFLLNAWVWPHLSTFSRAVEARDA